MFQTRREYGRNLLAPVKICECAPAVRETPSSRPSTLRGWKSSTHRFVGTEDRASSRAWPATKFQQDPGSIPDDATFNIPYNPETAVPKDAGDPASAWTVYADENSAKNASNFIPPWIVAKRFLPERPLQDLSKAAITLLMVPGVGAPKEVRASFQKGLWESMLILESRCWNPFYKASWKDNAAAALWSRKSGYWICHGEERRQN